MIKDDCYAVVTGASKGFGKAISKELAKRNFNLILVSLPDEGLLPFSKELEKSGIKTAVYETDLHSREAVLGLSQWISTNFKVSMLVNNVGIGGTAEFAKTDLALVTQSIHLNVMVMAMLTHQLLPILKKQGNAYILNVSSVASFHPLGYKAVYSASKVFINYFSESLSQELKGTNVHIATVCPGPMKTNEDNSRRLAKYGFLGKISEFSTEKVAEIAIRRLFKKKSFIVVGTIHHLSRIAVSILPKWIKQPIITRTIKRELELD